MSELQTIFSYLFTLAIFYVHFHYIYTHRLLKHLHITSKKAVRFVSRPYSISSACTLQSKCRLPWRETSSGRASSASKAAAVISHILICSVNISQLINRLFLDKSFEADADILKIS